MFQLSFGRVLLEKLIDNLKTFLDTWKRIDQRGETFYMLVFFFQNFLHDVKERFWRCHSMGKKNRM